MQNKFIGNILVAQSGGPTSVINSSLAGIIHEFNKYNNDNIKLYGGLNSIKGILNEDLIDLSLENKKTILGLRYTPGAALGTSRYKIKYEQEYEKIIKIFKAHNIKYFIYIGGNDSQDTTFKINEIAKSKNYNLQVIGLPKTIDNDLVYTNHSPGYGSTIKYLSTIVKEISLDNISFANHDLVFILEVMGRNTGWIAAGSTLSKYPDINNINKAPHLIYIPEIIFNKKQFLEDVKKVLKKNKFCFIVVSEGILDEQGNYILNKNSNDIDSFGHQSLGGVGSQLANYIEQKLSIKVRTSNLGINQRSAIHCSSKADNEEAYILGSESIKACINGISGKMINIIKNINNQYEYGLVSLEKIANNVKFFPKKWINVENYSFKKDFYEYAFPLIQGNVFIPYKLGLPNFVSLKKIKIEKKVLLSSSK